jgi:hypothetical protein
MTYLSPLLSLYVERWIRLQPITDPQAASRSRVATSSAPDLLQRRAASRRAQPAAHARSTARLGMPAAVPVAARDPMSSEQTISPVAARALIHSMQTISLRAEGARNLRAELRRQKAVERERAMALIVAVWARTLAPALAGGGAGCPERGGRSERPRRRGEEGRRASRPLNQTRDSDAYPLSKV